MKKKYIVMIVLALIIAIIVAISVYNVVIEQGKKYEKEEVKQYNYFLLKQNNSYGVIDKKGNIIIEAEYEEIKIPNPQKAVFVCYQKENTKVLNERKEEILAKYNNIQPIRLKNISSDLMYEKSILKYEQDGKYGLIDFGGKEITKPKYQEIDTLPYKEGELIVKQNDKLGVINIKGNELIQPKFDGIKIDEYYTEQENYQNAGYIVTNKTEEGYRYRLLRQKRKRNFKNRI